MASISSATRHKMPSASAGAKKSTKSPAIGTSRATKKPAASRRGSVAPPLKANALGSEAAISKLKALSKAEQKVKVLDFVRQALGGEVADKTKPHEASTTRHRAGAAADVAIAARELGAAFVLKECFVLDEMQRMLFPDGIQVMFSDNHNEKLDEDTTSNTNVSNRLKPSTSALSLASMDETTVTSVNSFGTDSKRGKSTPPSAREGSLLIIRALCQFLGKSVEHFVVGAFLAAAIDECGSSSSFVREAAEDVSVALVALANTWAVPSLIVPLLLQSLRNSNEWRVKFNSLERIAQCAKTSPAQICRLLPVLIPAITDQVWDTKAQVTKAANSTLLAICQTNTNADIKKAIPAVVHAICKPSDTNKAIDELMGTTFVVSVDAPTLSILCPVLARALKEKLAIHKRAACLVISNMSRLVSSPQDVAPFGPLLVPELKKVATNVQFEEIRDEALKALSNLTKALGSTYQEEGTEEEKENADAMAEEATRVAAEQQRIKAEREAAEKIAEETRKKEEEERKRFKEAMDAQRELDKIEQENVRKAKEEEQTKLDQERRSTKGSEGKCQGCGLKKCKKTCLFYGK